MACCLNGVTIKFHSFIHSYCITNEYCTTEFHHCLHNWLLYFHFQFARTCTKNAQVSLDMCNILIISGSFPTIFICVFCSLPYKLPTWLTCNCVNILYQPATPVTTRVKSIFLFLRDTPVLLYYSMNSIQKRIVTVDKVVNKSNEAIHVENRVNQGC